MQRHPPHPGPLRPETNISERTALHYIYDPFCGWCYAAAPLLTAASDIEGLTIVAHGGGMLTGQGTKQMSQEWREFVRPHEDRITALSGQQFGPAYLEQTQFNYDVVLDSGPPTAAMLAAEELSGVGLAMLKRLQVGYYIEGRPIADIVELLRIAEGIGLEAGAFALALASASRNLEAHFDDSRKLLSSVGGRGFPTLVVEHGGALRNLHIGHYLGKPDEFRRALQDQLYAAR